MCGYAYFGADHIVFGTDTLLGGEANSNSDYRCTFDTIRSIEQMDIPEAEKEKIFEINATKLLKIAK